jgi:kynurenine formamidase
VTGTDAWSWDAPFIHTARMVAETGDASLIWEGHRAGMVCAYCHLEKLANLETLPATGFEVICFPVKVKGGSAGWCRPVAVLRD